MSEFEIKVLQILERIEASLIRTEEHISWLHDSQTRADESHASVFRPAKPAEHQAAG